MNAVVLLKMPLASHDADAGASVITWPECHVLLLIILTQEIVWCYWWHWWHDVTLTSASIALHHQKIYVESCFVYLNWRNAVVTLMKLLASHDADGNGITWPKCHVASLFDHLDLWNGMVPLMTHWHDVTLTLALWHYMNQKVILHIVSIILT